MDWDKFAFDWRLDLDALRPGLISAEALREALSRLLLPQHWRASLDRLNRVRAVHGTTAMEGNQLSEAEAARQLDLLDQSPAATAPTDRDQTQLRNAGVAQQWVRTRFGPDLPPVTLSDLFHLHVLLTRSSDQANNEPGRLRTFEVSCGSPELGGVHRGAPHPRLPQFMHDYIEMLGSRRFAAQHPVVRALLAHFFLVTLHPFGDGNGGTSRLVEAAVLYQGNYNLYGFYGLSNFFYRNEREYKTLLQRSRRDQPFPLQEFVSFGLRGFIGELDSINRFVQTKLNRLVYRDTMARARQQRVSPKRCALNAREYALLDFLLQATEPDDPFAEQASKRIKLSHLLAQPFIRQAYGGLTPRTLKRELLRLAQRKFVLYRFDLGPVGEGSWIELNFDAIAHY